MVSNFIKRLITSIFLILIFFSALFYSQLSWKILVIIFLCLCFYEIYNLICKIVENKIFFIVLNFTIVLYLSFFYYLLIILRGEFGETFILILIFTCVFSDIGGYVFGKIIRGPKLTKISPKKTISGSIGSIIFTVLGTYLFVLLLKKIDQNSISLDFSIMLNIWLILMSVFSQIGDLLISYLKRKANVKDTGNLLPGHGGVLDRVDGIMFAIPLGVLTYFIFGFI